MPRWRKEEICSLTESYGKVPTEQIARKINKSVGAIYSKASRIGIDQTPVVEIDTSKPRFEELGEYELGYIAGFIDGEGSIYLVKTKNKGNKKGYSLHPKLSLYNTRKEALEIIRRLIGGGGYSKRLWSDKRLDKKHKKENYILELYSGEIAKLLPKIKLLIKEKQRKLILKALPLAHSLQKGNSDLELLELRHQISEENKR